jgi:hypothetical protein
MINNITEHKEVSQMTKQEKILLQQISDVAWLVHQGPNKVGILNKDVQEHYTYITGRELVNFADQTQVVEHFGNMSLFDDQITISPIVNDRLYIKGFEVDYHDPYALEESHPDYDHDLPLYTKIQGSNIYYAAGYYCINFEKGWKHAHGPKLSTLQKYGYRGPFRTELEMRQELKKLNKKA